MGAIQFIIYNTYNGNININFTKSFMQMKNRGPDDTYYKNENSIIMNKLNEELFYRNLTKGELRSYQPLSYITGFHRMSTSDTSYDASQPFEDPIINKISTYPDLRNRPKRKLLCNGEIYNYNEIINKEKFNDRDLQSQNNVEIIMPLYIKYGLTKTLDMIDGDYTFVLAENLNTFKLNETNIYVVRDKLGTRSMYMVKHKKELFYMFVTELKGIPKYILNDKNYYIMEIPPGTYWSFNNSIINKNQDEFIRYHDWNIYRSLDYCTINSTSPNTIADIYENIKTKLTNSIKKKIRSDLNIGILLSGGFDSSIITSLLIKILKEQNYNFEINKLNAFTIGDINSSDVVKAQECISYLENKYNIDIIHHVISLDNSVTSLLDTTKEIVEILETHDYKTIKESVPFKYLYEYISKKTNVKILFSGDGLDELCGYENYKNLNDEDFQIKSVKLIKNLSKYNLLRDDKLASFYGLQIRQPFLDIDIIKYILSIHPKLKKPMVYKYSEDPIEKYIIRKSFDNDENLLNENILWRRHDICDNNNTKIDELNNSIQYMNSDNNIIQNDYIKRIFNKYYGNNVNIIKKQWDEMWL